MWSVGDFSNDSVCPTIGSSLLRHNTTEKELCGTLYITLQQGNEEEV